MEENNMMGMGMAFFPYTMGSEKVLGSLIKSDMHQPSADGAIVYLNGNPDLQNVIDKIEDAGGKLITPKTNIGEDMGYMAFFTDTEGNRMALHSMK